MSKSSVLALLLLPAAAIADSGARSGDIPLRLTAHVTISEQGRIASLEWQETRPALAGVIAHLEPVVRGWEFDPGTVDGEPRETTTTLFVSLLARDMGDGSAALNVVAARTGAVTERVMPPRYPADALRSRAEAEVAAIVEIDPDGGVHIAEFEYVGNRDRYRDAFLKASRATVESWTFRLESVGGHPVAARMRIPITFCLPDQRRSWCEAREQQRLSEAGTAAGAGEPAQATALTSAVRLRSDPAGAI